MDTSISTGIGLSASRRSAPTTRGTYGYYEVNDLGTIGKAGANIISLYVQDQWQIGDRLTLNLGLRTENEKVPSFRTGHQARTRSSSASATSSRHASGVAYDLLGNGRAKLYGAAAATSTGRSTSCARGSFGGDIWCIKYRAIDNPNDPLTATFDNAPGRDLWQRRTAAAAAIAACQLRSTSRSRI